ncbi:MAG: matrixin family metalloprotease [Myxococcota bacterium]
MMRKAAVASAASALVLLGAQPAAAWCQMTSEAGYTPPGEPCATEGVPLAWERRCISYALDAEGSLDLDLETVRQEAETAFAAWTGAACPGGGTVDIEVAQLDQTATCDQDEFNSNGGNVNVIAFVRDWEERELEGVDRIFALTTVWHDTSSGEILDVDMLVNEQQGPYAVCPEAGCTSSGRTPVDLRNVLTHEAGHFFGIGHTDVEISSEIDEEDWPTMTTTAARGVTFMRTLADDDVDALCSVYPPGSLPGSCADEEAFAPIGGYDLDCTDDGGGGRCSVAGVPGRPAGAPAGLLLGFALITALRRARRAPRS